MRCSNHKTHHRGIIFCIWWWRTPHEIDSNAKKCLYELLLICFYQRFSKTKILHTHTHNIYIYIDRYIYLSLSHTHKVRLSKYSVCDIFCESKRRIFRTSNHIFRKYISWLIVFYGISTLVDYLMLNYVIHIICKSIVFW